MPTHKSTFESKDTTLPAFGSQDCHSVQYMGTERRAENRRTGIDRRGDVRFDLEAKDRRQCPGRRSGDEAAARWI